jgi:hypothetical protein
MVNRKRVTLQAVDARLRCIAREGLDTTAIGERFRQIGIYVQLFATTPNLQRILYALESQVPYALVENITIRPLGAFHGLKPAHGNDPELSMLLKVTGFAFAEGKKK